MSNRQKNKLGAVLEVVVEAYDNGATLREIAELHDVSAGTVRNALKSAGVEMRNRGRRSKAKPADPRRLDLEEVASEQE